MPSKRDRGEMDGLEQVIKSLVELVQSGPVEKQSKSSVSESSVNGFHTQIDRILEDERRMKEKYKQKPKVGLFDTFLRILKRCKECMFVMFANRRLTIQARKKKVFVNSWIL